MRRDRQHPRLASDIVRSWIALGIGLPAYVAGMIAFAIYRPGALDEVAPTPLLLTWALICAILIGLTLGVFVAARPPALRSWLIATSPPRRFWARAWWSINGGGAIWWAATGAAVTLYAVVSLALASERPSTLVFWSAVSVVVLSIALIIVSFAVHYARIDATDGGFEFPGSADRRFGDYVYLAVQVATTFGGSDVSLKTLQVRRAVSMQSLISWTYNTVLVALLVSVLLRGA